MAAKLLTLTFDVDVRRAAATFQIPALVLHRGADRAVRWCTAAARNQGPFAWPRVLLDPI